MGWVALEARKTYEEAQAVAEKYDLACVSYYHYKQFRAEEKVQPIVTRIPINDRWYNYFEDGTYKITLKNYMNNSGYECRSYAPYYYVPDKIRYADLLKFLKKYWYQFKGVYDVYITYVNEEMDMFTYSVKLGVMNLPLVMAFDNPLLYFEAGKPENDL